MSKLDILRSRLGAKNIADALGKTITVVFAEVVEPKDEDGYESALLTDDAGNVWRSTGAAVVDFVRLLTDVMGAEWEPVKVKPVARTSKRGRDYIAIELAD